MYEEQVLWCKQKEQEALALMHWEEANTYAELAELWRNKKD